MSFRHNVDDHRIIELTENVHVFESFPTTAMIDIGDGVVAIDSPMSPTNSTKWREHMRRFGPVRHLIYTEHHADHTVGGYYLQPESVIASELTAAELGRGSAGTVDQVLNAFNTWARDPSHPSDRMPGNYEFLLPSITFSERMTLKVGGQRLVLFLAPGHTRGQTIVHAPDARVAFVADAAMPFQLIPVWHSGDPWDSLKSLALLEMLDVDWFVPGHGRPFKREVLHSIRTTILLFMDRVRELRAAGWTPERMLEEGGLFPPPAEIVDQPGLQPASDFFATTPKAQVGIQRWMQIKTIRAACDAIDRHPMTPQPDRLDLNPLWSGPQPARPASPRHG